MSRLTWPELLIENMTSDQFRDWLAPWSGIVTGRVAPVFMSKFGFWFLRRPEGHVEMLDVFAGELTRMADTNEDFIRDVNGQRWQEKYLFSELVFQLHEAGKVAGAGANACTAHPASGGCNPAVGDHI